MGQHRLVFLREIHLSLSLLSCSGLHCGGGGRFSISSRKAACHRSQAVLMFFSLQVQFPYEESQLETRPHRTHPYSLCLKVLSGMGLQSSFSSHRCLTKKCISALLVEMVPLWCRSHFQICAAEASRKISAGVSRCLLAPCFLLACLPVLDLGLLNIPSWHTEHCQDGFSPCLFGRISDPSPAEGFSILLSVGCESLM